MLHANSSYGSEKKKEGAIRRPEVGPPANLKLIPVDKIRDQAAQSLLKALSADISLSGILLGIPKEDIDMFHSKQRVQLEIGITEVGGKVRTFGFIRHVKIAGRDKKVRLVAIEFVDISPADIKKLREFIYGKDHLSD